MGVTADIGHPQDLGYNNGRLAPDSLTRIGIGGHRLWGPAADSWAQMARDAAAAGVSLFVTDSYRTYDQQVDLKKRKPTLAATPGSSQHGWGLAVDADQAAIKWLETNGARYGWGRTRSDEPWHWEYLALSRRNSTASNRPANLPGPGQSVAARFPDGGDIGNAAQIVVENTPIIGPLFGLGEDAAGALTGWVGDLGRLVVRVGAVGLAVTAGAVLVILGVWQGVRKQLPTAGVTA